MSEIEIPSFDWTSFYYPQVLESLITFKRANVPELTDESPQEPLMQLLRAFACVGHLSNTLADLVANECTLPTSQLPETVRNMLRLIDYEMASATPAQTDVVYELAQVLSASAEVVPANALAATSPEGGASAIYFEALTALIVTRTDQLTKALAVEATVATDVTTEANSTPATSTFVPWATPEGGDGTQAGDTLLVGHSEVMAGEINVELTVASSGISGIWEYYDGDWDKSAPTAVTDNGTYLTFELTGYLGAAQLSGTEVRVKLNSSGAYATGFSYWSGGKNYVDTGLLGQTTPSTSAGDYTVGSDWEQFPDVNDGTSNLTQNGKVEFTLPQTIDRDWSLGTFDGTAALWARFRIVPTGSMTAPTIGQIRIDTGKQYCKRLVTQGRRQVDDPLGSSTGVAGQRFEGSRDNYIDSTAVLSVDRVGWIEVSDWLSSRATDRHYKVELGEDDRPTFVFGGADGVGAIPAVGVGNIAVEYRYNAEADGNVGANTITNDKSGLRYVNQLWNPRPATGWAAAAGSTTASLENAKIEGPASLRVRDVALGPDDVETLLKRARQIDSDLIALSRVRAIEEGFGPKTIEAVVVPSGGALAAQASIDALSEFLNGNKLSSPVKPKRLVSNQEATAVNYTRRLVAVTAAVEDTGDVTVAQIEAALTLLLQPEALQADGITWTWNFGGKVAVSKLQHEIFKVAATIIDVDVTVPASDITLGSRELPYVGTLSITLV